MAFVILAAFYICYFAKMISQHKQGIKTNMLGKGKTGFVKITEVVLKIVTNIIPAVEVASIVINTYTTFLWLKIIGVLLGVAGVLIFLISSIEMKDSWRAGVPDVPQNDKTELITGGIYSLSRNPAFLGFDLVYISILFMFFNWLLFIITVLGVLMLHIQIVNVEEDYLTSTFGEEYIQYRKRVCRYFGRKLT